MKIAGYPLAEFMERVALKFSKNVPSSEVFPSTDVKLRAGESPNGQIIEFMIVVQMNRSEAKKWLLFKDEKEEAEEEEHPRPIFVSAAHVANGYYILTSMMEMSIVRIKFHTKGEALAYAEHHRLRGYKETHLFQDQANDPWFEGELGKKPTYENGLLWKIPEGVSFQHKTMPSA